MNAPLCTLKDVDQAAEELMALGCKVGALHINDGAARLGFLGEIRAFAEEVYQDIKDGVISAAEGVEALWDEHEALRDKAGFYLTNGITTAAGAMQIKAGVTVTGGTLGVGSPFGALLISHGVNNIYEGSVNIYNGPKYLNAQGPMRLGYQTLMGGMNEGNILYGSIDILSSAGSLMVLKRKPKSIQLFRRDPINFEHAYKQSGKLALIFEGVANFVTILSMTPENNPEEN